MQVIGNSTQETRSGKNKLNIKDILSALRCTYSIEKDRITATPVDGNTTIAINVNCKLTSGTYYVKIGGVITNIAFNNGNGKIDSNISSSKAVTLSANSTFVTINIATTTAVDINFNDFYINEGNTDLGYEEYGVMPSPEFPSEIENCGDNVNFFDGELYQGYGNNGLKVSSEFVCNTNLIDVVESESYTISNNLDLNIVSMDCYKNNTFVKIVTSINNKTITIPEGVNQIRFNLYRLNSLSVSDFTFIKFEKGTHATTYSPFGCGNVNFGICNKNLFNFEEALITDDLIYDNTYLFFKIKGTKANTSYKVSNVFKDLNSLSYPVYVGLGTADNYKQGVSGVGKFFIYNKVYNEDRTVIETDESGKLYLFCATNTYTINTCKERWVKILQLVAKNMQIEEGTVATDYVEHKEQNFTFPLQQNQKMMSGSYLAEDGIHHRRKQVILGNVLKLHEGVALGTNCKFATYRFTDMKYSTVDINFICDRVTASASFRQFGGYTVSQQLVVLTTLDDTLENFNSKMNGAILEYELETETTESYTAEQKTVYNEIQKAYSYKNVTHVFSNDKVSCKFDVEYYKDLETMFNNITAMNISNASEVI